MNPKHHVSQPIAKQLAEAGIVIESEFVWVCDPKLENWHTVHIQRGRMLTVITRSCRARTFRKNYQYYKLNRII